MRSIPQLLGSLIATLLVYGVYRLIKLIYAELTSPLRDLPGPKSSSFMYGNLKDIWEAENSVLHEQWVQQYGNTIKYKGVFGMNRLYTTDLKALNHVLMNSNDYQKPEAARHNLSHIVGPGVLVVEGEKHRQQRRIMNPAFGPSQIRELTPIFIEKSIQLRDVLASRITNKEEPARVDVLSPLSKTTLDVIGLAGFNYKFDALSDHANELNEAFSTIFGANSRMSLVPILRAWFPFLRWLRVEHDAEVKRARQTMARIGEQLLHDSKQAVRGTNEKESWRSRDLLSILVRANMATDLPESQRMSDEDVLAQVPTFLVAGHETTSTATTWALYALTQSPDVQKKLREELFTIDTDNPTMDELNALPYLDYVVRETLRVHAPVPSTIRIATKDDVLPLNNPVTDLKGRVHHDLHVKKGQTMLIPLLAINRDKSIWGEDAKQFRPERWESSPEAANQIPGVWGNLMSFLGGPRACIGYRFSLVETKALLFTLVRAFEFELAVPAEDIGKKSSIVQRPIIRSDPQAGNQMPLLIKRYSHA